MATKNDLDKIFSNKKASTQSVQTGRATKSTLDSIFKKEEPKKNKKDENTLRKIKKAKESSDKIINLVKSTPKTIVNTGVEIGKGIIDVPENILDTGLQLGTSKLNPYYWFNQDKLKRHQDIAKEVISKKPTQSFIDNQLGYGKKLSTGKTVQETLDEGSLVKSNNLGGSIARNIGTMLPSVMVGNMGATAGLGTTGAILSTGVRSYGSGIDTAYNEGATREQANLYGLGNAVVESATEWITGGIPGVKTKWFSGLDNLVAKGLGKTTLNEVSNSITKELIQAGYKVVGEGFEEALAEIINPYLKNATYTSGQKINWQNVIDSAVSGAITGGILNAPSDISNIRSVTANKPNAELSNLEGNTQTNVLSGANILGNQEQALNVPQNVKKEAITPIKTYHGTTNQNKFESFNVSKTGNLGTGIYLTTNKDRADSFSKGRNDTVTNGRIIETVANLSNPLVASQPLNNDLYNELRKYIPKDSQFYGNELNEYKYDTDNSIYEINHLLLKDISQSGIDTSKILQKYGYDGIVKMEDGKIEDVVVFDSSKISISNQNTIVSTRELTPYDFEKSIPKDPTKESSYDIEPTTAQVRKTKVKEYREQAKEYVKNIANWKDKKWGLSYETNTMKRNFRDIIGDQKEADAIVEEYITPITKANAQKEKFITSYNDNIKKLNLSNKESTAVQMLGEHKYNPETNLKWQQVEDYIKRNKLNLKKIESSVEIFRNTYDKLIVEANKVLKEQGYKEIPYRKGYFPHFIEDKPNNIIGKMAEKLGWKFKNMELPTDIAGMTDIFKPGKTWFRNAQQRTGRDTDFNALKGYDNYIRGVADIIYHTENIQKNRALENEIRYQYSDKGIQDEIDAINNDENLSLEEKEERIDSVYARIQNQMPNLVTELRRFTDGIANKKDIGDRSMEQRIGRKFYNTMENINSRLSGNMVGLNISSAITNFIPITQAYSQISTKNMSKATIDTLKAFKQDDGFADKSIFLTNRTKQADRLYKTGVEKAGDIAGVVFKGIDSITANVIVRGKYLDNIEKGMTEQQAIENADEFAKDVIGGRDKGSMPTVFNQKNPIVRIFTSFQLEVANQYGYMFKDLPRDKRDEGLAKLTMAFVKMFFAAWLYNKGKEALTGTKSAFSPIDLIEENIETITSDNLSTGEKLVKSGTSAIKEVPFVGGIFGGGRLPINAAIPNVGTTLTSASSLMTGEGNQTTAANNLKKELLKPVAYLVLPFGGGQIKKSIEGLSMYNKKVPGSYTTSGKMRFPVDTDLGSKIQAGIFGQYSSKNAREYFDKNRRVLSESQTKRLEYEKTPEGVKKTYDQMMKVREYNSLTKQYQELKKLGKDTSKVEKKIHELLKK